MNNRRNFYRILHVQPEAPLEIIKASYRSLMTKLKVHPDLGGDHESAALINKAYAMLSDPQRRRQYDEMLHSRNSQGRGQPTHEAPKNTSGPSMPYGSGGNKAAWDGGWAHSTAARCRCLFCGTGFAPTANKRCICCASPLSPAQAIPNDRIGELFGRRAAPRIAKAGALIIYPSWPHAGYSARLRDLSPTGINMLTEYGARNGHILKFDSIHLKGIARVVSVRANGENFSVHASFLTAEFVTKAGVFVTEKA
jgi:curved DNA-binding protein CbpA